MSKVKNRVNKIKKKLYATGGEVEEDFDSGEVETSLFGDDFLGFNTPSITEEDYTPNNYNVPMATGNFVNHIVGKESGGNYLAQSPNSSAVGKYQFLWDTWGSQIKKVTGVDSKEGFRQNPKAQEAFFNYYNKTTLSPQAKKYLPKVKKYFPNATEDQVKSMLHFAGAGNLENAIKTGNFSKPLDANGTSITSYLMPKNRRQHAGGGYASTIDNQTGKALQSAASSLNTIVGGGIGSGASSLLGSIFDLVNTIGNDTQTFNRQPIVSSRQTSQFNPYSKDYGNNQLPTFANGGQVPIEAEGDELIETPLGNIGELQGPSHEQGGINMEVPEGTKIYSDRLKLDGKSMADRKKAREKALARLEKLSSKRPNDLLLKNTYKRTQEVLSMEDSKDMAIQEATNQIMNGKKKFADGGWAGIPYSYEEQPLDLYGGLLNQPNPITEMGYLNTGNTVSPLDIDLPTNFTSDGKPIYNMNSIQGATLGEGLIPDSPPKAELLSDNFRQSLNTNSNTGNRFDKVWDALSKNTTGDYIGMASNLFGAFAPLVNTNRNRAGDLPNKNFFKNYGRDALAANEQAQGYVEGQQQRALEDLKTQLNSSRARNRNSAGTINALRALDLASDLGYNKGTDSIYNSFSQQMMGLLGQKSQLENQQDTYVMQGEAARDLADRQDRDNYYAQRGQDLTNMASNLTGLGKNLNTSHNNDMMMNLLRQLSMYGMEFDRNGNLINKKD